MTEEEKVEDDGSGILLVNQMSKDRLQGGVPHKDVSS